MKSFLIRPAQETDIDSIVNLWEELTRFHSQLDSIFTPCKEATENYRTFAHSFFSQTDSAFIFVAEEINSKRIVGYISGKTTLYPPVYRIKKKGSIFDTVVLNEFRRHHIGQQLFKKALDWFQDKNISRIELSVAEKNEVSQAFWNSLGFNPHMHTLFFDR
ncbi:N-acetyltransferase family protein [Candidatus Lokiarchaeum ossiferum]|uniref:N-acetyltransferase family protein n=1 Tax=Candidatus Lokiarchaeum ossiferum TaxID=2951803 RepID=UPI00352FDCFD